MLLDEGQQVLADAQFKLTTDRISLFKRVAHILLRDVLEAFLVFVRLKEHELDELANVVMKAGESQRDDDVTPDLGRCFLHLCEGMASILSLTFSDEAR